MTAVHVTLTVTDAFLFCVKKPLNVLFNVIVNPNKLLYFLWYSDVFSLCSFQFSVPFPKRLPRKKVSRGHFGPQVKFFG